MRPSDSRMLVALGESYEKLEKTSDAMKCFWKAHCVGDIEGGIALLRLARLYDKTGDVEQAAAAWFTEAESFFASSSVLPPLRGGVTAAGPTR